MQLNIGHETPGFVQLLAGVRLPSDTTQVRLCVQLSDLG